MSTISMMCTTTSPHQGQRRSILWSAYEIDSPRAYDRETSSLVKASDAFSCNRLTLIAFTQTRDVEIGGKTIHIISALDWLLRYGT